MAIDKPLFIPWDITKFTFRYIYIYIYIFVISIFTNAAAQARYDTRSIFKWSLTGLKSEFSFS